MEGFRRFRRTPSLHIPQPRLPESHGQCVPGSSSQSPIGETHFDQTLEAAFSRLKVSSFHLQPQLSSFDGEFSDGSGLKYPLNNQGGFGGENFVALGNRELQRLNINNAENGVLSHLGLEDCWVESSDIHSSNGFLSNLSQYCDSSPHLPQHPLNCLPYCRGRIFSLAKDLNGCRFLQKEMEAAPNKELIDLIFFDLIQDVAHLMMDPHGNYVVSKLVEVCSEEQRTQIILMLTNNNGFPFVRSSLDNRGTRTVQRLVKYATTKQQISLIMEALSPYAFALSKNSNGQHVIVLCLEHFSVEDNMDLLYVVASNCLGIAKDKCGCCVIQKCVELSSGEIRQCLIDEIISNALVLSEDCFGNYVVQQVLDLRIQQNTAKLLRQLEGSYFSLSWNKYGSNVVEKCLIESGEEQSSQIIFELLINPNISSLLLHPFGNYVIQTALSVSKGIYHEYLLRLVDLHSPTMLGNYFGQKVLAWRERRGLQRI